MKKCSLLLLLSLIFLTGCDFKEKYEGDTAKGITMTIKEGTLTNKSATIIIEDLKGKNYMYGYGYSIFKKDGNEWFSIPHKTQDILMAGLRVNNHNILELEHNWEYSYGKLPPGEYKIVKYAMPNGELVDYSISTNFIIK